MRNTTLMALGQYVFGMNTTSFEQLQRQIQYKHGAVARIGARDAFQRLGPGDDVITLSGIVAPPVTGKIASLDDLDAMGQTGNAFVLVDGTGKVYGSWFIESLATTATYLMDDGTPRRIEFTLQIKRNDDPTRLATPATRTDTSAADAQAQAAAAASVRNGGQP